MSRMLRWPYSQWRLWPSPARQSWPCTWCCCPPGPCSGPPPRPAQPPAGSSLPTYTNHIKNNIWLSVSDPHYFWNFLRSRVGQKHADTGGFGSETLIWLPIKIVESVKNENTIRHLEIYLQSCKSFVPLLKAISGPHMYNFWILSNKDLIGKRTRVSLRLA